MRITLVGYGYVGQALYDAFNPVYEMKIVDPKYTPLEVEIDDTNIIIAVGTPYNDGCDISSILSVLPRVIDGANVLIKSTVDMRGIENILNSYPNLNITFSPEFLRGETATTDLLLAEYHILGGGDTEFWGDVFKKRFPCIEIHTCTPIEASVIKYAENSFLGMKVTFFNQLKDISEIYGAEFDVVRHLLTLDKRINPDHSFVTSERGYGGHCLPKDIDSLLDNLNDKGYESIMKSVKIYNDKTRKET